MSRVIFKCKTVATDDTVVNELGPCSLCYIDLDANRAAALCQIIEALRAIQVRNDWPFAGAFNIQVTSNPAHPFDLFADPDLDIDHIINTKGTQTLSDFLLDAYTHPVFMTAGDVSFDTDENKLRIYENTMLVIEDGVMFQFAEEDSDKISQSSVLFYEDLLDLAGRDPHVAELEYRESSKEA